jgi:hypothetical protein
MLDALLSSRSGISPHVRTLDVRNATHDPLGNDHIQDFISLVPHRRLIAFESDEPVSSSTVERLMYHHPHLKKVLTPLDYQRNRNWLQRATRDRSWIPPGLRRPVSYEFCLTDQSLYRTADRQPRKDLDAVLHMIPELRQFNVYSLIEDHKVALSRHLPMGPSIQIFAKLESITFTNIKLNHCSVMVLKYLDMRQLHSPEFYHCHHVSPLLGAMIKCIRRTPRLLRRLCIHLLPWW